eukprot:gene4410-4663_t
MDVCNSMRGIPLSAMSETLRKTMLMSLSYSGDDFRLGSAPDCADALFNAYGPPVVDKVITGVVLMHSTPNAMGGCPAGLHRSIQAWITAGYTFVKVSDVIREAYGGLTPEQVLANARNCSKIPVQYQKLPTNMPSVPRRP